MNDTWTVVPFNTEVFNDIVGALIATSQSTLPAGTYEIEAWSCTDATQSNMLRLYNVTDAQVELWGTSSYVEYLASAAGYSKLFGKITIAAAKVFEFQHNCNSFGVPRLGFEMGYGWTVPHETYTWAKIRKVA